jgi:hypothetical protein
MYWSKIPSFTGCYPGFCSSRETTRVGGQVSLAWASYTIKSTLALPNEDNRNAHRKVLDYPNEILACRLRPSAQSPRSVGTLYWTSIVHGKKASLPHVTAQGPDQDENSWISEEN